MAKADLVVSEANHVAAMKVTQISELFVYMYSDDKKKCIQRIMFLTN